MTEKLEVTAKEIRVGDRVILAMGGTARVTAVTDDGYGPVLTVDAPGYTTRWAMLADNVLEIEA